MERQMGEKAKRETGSEGVADRHDLDLPTRIMHRRRGFWLPSRCADRESFP